MEKTSWLNEWNAIAARIDGLARAGEFFYRSIEKRTEDTYGALKKILLPQSGQIYDYLIEYDQKHKESLPNVALDTLNQFLSDFRSYFVEKIDSGTLDNCLPFLQIRLTALSAFKSQFEFCLTDHEHHIRTIADRALLHLQRCIMADITERNKWKNAFQEGEPSCEKIGSVHLLWHGIWAFKADASGGRTDLIMGNKIDNPSRVEEAALGLVLTEWKRANSASDAKKKYEEGMMQAAQYSVGILGGMELKYTRYIIVVTSDIVKKVPEVREEGVLYRFVNIAVDPSVPSITARKNA